MKKLNAYLLIFLMVILSSSFIAIPFTADNTAFAEKPTDAGLKIDGKAAYLTDSSTNEIMYEYNSEEHLPIASMNKIMTALLILEEVQKGNLKLDQMITISPEASGMGGSQMFLDTNDMYSVSDLLKGIIVVSANDACIAMAETISGGESQFVQRMNERASELGMKNTNFVNCTGLPTQGQYSCAKDVAKMTSELIKHPEYYNYSTIWLEEYTHPSGRITELTNTNKLIRFYKGCDGGKTGFTNEAMFCLSASAKRGNMRLIAVVIGSPSSKARFATVSNLLNFGFANYTEKVILSKEEYGIQPMYVKGGVKSTINVKLSDDITILSHRNEKKDCIIEYEYVEGIKAPIKEGDILGKVYVVANGEKVKTIDVIAAESINVGKYGDYINKVLENW